MESLNYYERLKAFKEKIDARGEVTVQEFEDLENALLFGVKPSPTKNFEAKMKEIESTTVREHNSLVACFMPLITLSEQVESLEVSVFD